MNVIHGWGPHKVILITLSDVIAFLMIAACSYNSTQMFRSSSLFGRVVQDATVYFLLIVWVHMTVTIYVAKMGTVSPFPLHTFILCF